MKQKTPIVYFLLILSATMFTGCNNEPQEPPAVVINIKAVADATGINEQIKARTEEMKQQIAEDMKELSGKLSKEIENENPSLGDNPSEEDEKKIQNLQKQLFKKIMQARAAENKRLATETSVIQQVYLDEIMSVAKEIALEHGASIILKAMGVFWSDGSVDITEEVIGRMTDGRDKPHAD